MFTDSHCHLFHIAQQMSHFPLILKMMQEESFSFIMDIGTEPEDFRRRYDTVSEAWGNKGTVPDFIHFSAGLWPSKIAIEQQDEALTALEADIKKILQSGQRYAAVGECGIDRYWNHDEPAGVKALLGTNDLAGEEALFKKQLALAKRYDLAVIIHSRDGFEPTLRCIDEIGWHKGVIHCFSYGKAEAEAFLKRGWYLSFAGGITYSEDQDSALKMQDVLRSIPQDRLLLETDAPYLAPYPVKWEINTPLYIPYIYEQASNYLECSINHLCQIVYQNSCRLFAVAEHSARLTK